MDENKFVKDYVSLLRQREGVIIGPGDDCAVLAYDELHYQLIATDQVIANVHYEMQTDPGMIAKKLLKRNLSDIAAMGGWPTQAVLTIALGNVMPKDREWYNTFFSGLEAEAEKWNMSVCGGDVSSSLNKDDVFTLTILGFVKKEQLALRANAKAGDYIVCTGQLGNSFRSNHHLSFCPRLEEASFLCGTYTNCMMDISDGLLKDLERILIISGLGAVIDKESLPLREGAGIESACTEGEDYELLFSVEKDKYTQLIAKWPFDNVPLSVIGEFTNNYYNEIIDKHSGSVLNNNKIGFDHLEK